MDTYTRKDINEYTIQFTSTIPAQSFKQSYNLFLKDYSKDLDVKGFRKGNVPSDLISDEVKEMLKFQTFEKLAPMYINTAISKENIVPIAPPEYTDIPKILDDLDITFSYTVTIMPKFKLGNLKNVKVKKEKLLVEEKEIDTVIQELKSSQKTKAKEINDDWAKEIGKILEDTKVDTLDKLREKIRGSLQIQKDHYQLHQLQDQALKLAIEESKLDIPQAAIDFEARERERYFNEDMQKKGVNVDDFLKKNNITLEKMRELWLLDAKEAIQTDVFLNLYADTRDITVTEEELEKKIEVLKKNQPNADVSLFSNPQWREYVRGVERKEKAFKMFVEEILGKENLDTHN